MLIAECEFHSKLEVLIEYEQQEELQSCLPFWLSGEFGSFIW